MGKQISYKPYLVAPEYWEALRKAEPLSILKVPFLKALANDFLYLLLSL